jgi:hypothetical protein
MTGTEALVLKGAAKVAGVAPKAVAPAIRAVRKALNDRDTRQAMTRILESAMHSVAKGESAQLSAVDIEKVAKGAVSIAWTGSVREANWATKAVRWLQETLRRRRARRPSGLSTSAINREVTLWVRASASAHGVDFFMAQEHAQAVAEIFVEKTLVHPDPKDDAYSKRMGRAWLASAEEAEKFAALADAINYQSVSVGVVGAAAATAAGELFHLTGSQVIGIAAAFGAAFVVISGGVIAEHRRRASVGDFTMLLNLRTEVRDFLVDLALVLGQVMSSPAMARPARAASPRRRDDPLARLETLRGDLDDHLLPRAIERAPNLAALLEQISHQLRLLAQDRPTFDAAALRLAMEAAWQKLEPPGSDSPLPLQLAVRQHAPSELPAPEASRVSSPSA